MPFVLTKTGQIQEKISDKYKSSFKDKNVLKTQIWERENSNKEGEINITNNHTGRTDGKAKTESNKARYIYTKKDSRI
jgi:hypothetical protein